MRDGTDGMRARELTPSSMTADVLVPTDGFIPALAAHTRRHASMIDTRQLYKCDTHSINRSQARTGHDGGGGGGGGGSGGDDDDADDDDVDIDAGW